MIKDVLEATGLKREILAKKLFPDHAQPEQALRYVETEKRQLKESEIKILHDLMLPFIGENQFKGKISADGKLLLVSGKYIIQLNNNTFSLITDEAEIIESNARVWTNMTVEQFLDLITYKIKKHESNNQN
jgi:hypothetical protein